MSGKPKPITNGKNYLIDEKGDAKEMTCSELKKEFGTHAGEAASKAFQNFFSQHPNEF